MTNEESVTITQTAPDGTETVIEITQTKPDDATGDDQSAVEEVIDALFDSNADDSDDIDDVGDDADSEYTVASHTNDPDSPTVTDDVDLAGTTDEPVFAGSPDDAPSSQEETETKSDQDDAAAAEAQAHADAASAAQQAADDFEAQGDYAAAAQAREDAENEAWSAGDQSMLHGSDSTELGTAVDQQASADYYEQQEAIHAQQGDYEAAKEDASNAAYAQGNADYYGSGSDHTSQAKAEENQMDWAVWEQGNADYNAQAAEEYAAQGDFDHAEQYAGEAAEHQDMADYHGDLGEHGGDMGVYDTSSDVASGGSYEPADTSAVDYSSHDTGTDYSGE